MSYAETEYALSDYEDVIIELECLETTLRILNNAKDTCKSDNSYALHDILKQIEQTKKKIQKLERILFD